MPHKDREARNAYMRAYRRRRYASDPAYREKVKASSRATPRAVWRAHKAVRRALERGQLFKPLVCEQCDQAAALEAAHIDYEQPLLVRWLCRSCHRRFDLAEPKAANLREAA